LRNLIGGVAEKPVHFVEVQRVGVHDGGRLAQAVTQEQPRRLYVAGLGLLQQRPRDGGHVRLGYRVEEGGSHRP
jgi:hypothetical protein